MPASQDKDTLLARWLAGDLTEAEVKELMAQPELKDYERLLAATKRLAPPPYDAQSELARFKAERSGSAKERTLHPRPRPTRWRQLRPWLAAAAVIAILLTTWILWPAQSLHFSTGNGQTVLAALPDGSSIRLNADSELTFDNTDEERRVTLSGEAYFEVEPDPIPFVVHTELGDVTVVGTSFNVYQRAGELRVNCTSGQVRVVFARQPKAYSLTPGKSVALAVDGQVTEGPSDEAEALDWLSSRSVFNDRPLAEVIAELERQFDLDIQLPAELDLQKKMRAQFPNDDVEAALELVFSPLNDLKYVRNGRQVIVTIDRQNN